MHLKKKILAVGAPEIQIFHNEPIPVYNTKVPFEEIHYWPENFRTELDFEVIAQEAGKKIQDMSVEELTERVSKLPDMALSKLVRSIERNGVRSPMIILDDGTLLDGNRRYFACSLLARQYARRKQPRPQVLDQIPVWLIKKEDIDERKRHKILAETNFVDDLRVPWPLSVRARRVAELFERTRSEGRNEEQALEEILDLYGVDAAESRAYIDTINLTANYIDSSEPQRNKRRQLVQEKFVYFWEFRNKAMAGSGTLEPEELREVKKLFFLMISNNRFKNLKQVEPMIRAYKSDYEWELLKTSGGVKIDVIEAWYKETKAIKSVEDKVASFHRWLQKLDSDSLSERTKELLQKVSDVCRTMR